MEDEEQYIENYIKTFTTAEKTSITGAILKGKNELNDMISLTADFDLMIFGSQPAQSMKEVLFGTTQDKLMEKAACSVLKVQGSNF